MEPKATFVAGAILYDPVRKTVLLQHRDSHARTSPNKWGFFGGHNEEHESPKEVLIRELREEIGITFQENDLDLFLEYFINPELYCYVFVIAKPLKESEIVLGEGQGFAFVPVDTLHNYELTDVAKKGIETFLNSMVKPPDASQT
jgi:8-oxo-dGTP diphosphatase